MTEIIASNIPELSVSELSGALKRAIEDQFGFVRVRGEISGYRGPHGSGHCYFSLKDQGAKIDAVIWKTVFGRMRVKPEEGLEVVVTGKVSTFPGSSKYQIIVESLEPAGLGALMALLEERRRKLGAEGLFDQARKQLIPYLPRVIGVVTSPTGAVIRDILHRLSDRFPRHVLVWPVRVQGETSAAEVAAAVRGFNALPFGGRIPRPDVLIVARGGGSLEDLWSFNEEIAVRAVAESDIPLIAAVGHETDWTLIDLAADMRAPTPTGAAEMAVPVRSELLASLDGLARRHRAGQVRFYERLRGELRGLARGLPSPVDIIAVPRQRLDLAASHLTRCTAHNLRVHERQLAIAAQKLTRQAPLARLGRALDGIASLGKRLDRGLSGNTQRRHVALTRIEARFSPRLAVQPLSRGRDRLASIAQALTRLRTSDLPRRIERLENLASRLESLSYKSALRRGYVVVREGERMISSRDAVSPGAHLSLEFADGRAAVTADGAGEGASPKPATSKRPGPAKASGQGSLF